MKAINKKKHEYKHSTTAIALKIIWCDFIIFSLYQNDFCP